MVREAAEEARSTVGSSTAAFDSSAETMALAMERENTLARKRAQMESEVEEIVRAEKLEALQRLQSSMQVRIHYTVSITFVFKRNHIFLFFVIKRRI